MDDIIEQIAQQCGAREVAALGLLSRRQSTILNDNRIWQPLFKEVPLFRAADSRHYFLAVEAERKITKYIRDNSDEYIGQKRTHKYRSLQGNDNVERIMITYGNFGISHPLATGWVFMIYINGPNYTLYILNPEWKTYTISKNIAMEILRTHYHQY